jgi:hypothetical protein
VFTHVHFVQHNHDLCDEVSQDIMEKWQVEAMKAAAKGPKLTALAFTQNQVRQAILQRMEGADLVERGPNSEGLVNTWKLKFDLGTLLVHKNEARNNLLFY